MDTWLTSQASETMHSMCRHVNQVRGGFPMSHRFLTRMGSLSTIAILTLLAQTPAAGQQAATGATPRNAANSSSGFTVPRTAWGDPDLQGVYTFATLTPFQRPAAQAGKDVLSEEEQKALEEQLKKKQEENIAT